MPHPLHNDVPGAGGCFEYQALRFRKWDVPIFGAVNQHHGACNIGQGVFRGDVVKTRADDALDLRHDPGLYESARKMVLIHEALHHVSRMSKGTQADNAGPAYTACAQ